MKHALSILPVLVPLAFASSLVGCGASDSSEPISQAEAELMAEQSDPAGDPSASARPTEDGTRAHGRRGKHGHGHGDPAKMIEHFDENGDGVLSVDELPEHKRDHLATADTNGDGKLDIAELSAFWAAQRGKRFERKDTNGDGFLTVDEIGERHFEHMSVADANGDGKLTQDEIAAAFESGRLRDRRGGGHFGKRGHGFHGPPGPAKLIEHFDENENGTLEIDELPGRMSEKMAKADSNGDGSLTADELRQGMRAFAKQRFDKRDENGDGVLEAAEVGERHWRWLVGADADGDSKVTFDEVTEAFEAGRLAPPPHGKGRHGERKGPRGDR